MAPDTRQRMLTVFTIEWAPEHGMWRVSVRIGNLATSEYFSKFKNAARFVRTFSEEMDGEPA